MVRTTTELQVSLVLSLLMFESPTSSSFFFLILNGSYLESDDDECWRWKRIAGRMIELEERPWFQGLRMMATVKEWLEFDWGRVKILVVVDDEYAEVEGW